jgi:hypothetical protein
MSEWGLLFDAFKSGAKNSDELAALLVRTTKTDITDIFKFMPVDDLGYLFKNLDASKISDVFKSMDDVELVTLFKKIPDDAFTNLTSTLKQSDKVDIFAKLNKVDPTFANKFYPDAIIDQATDLTTGLKNPPSMGSTKTGVDGPVNDLSGSKLYNRANTISQTPEARRLRDKRFPADFDSPPIKGGEGYFERMKNWFRNAGKKQDKVFPDDANDLSKLDPVANSKFGKRALLKLGLFGAGGIAICMMMYDTTNPFTALREALKDIKETVQGLKEIADAAANAAKNAAKGGFDLIAWLGENWWMPAVGCLVFLIIFLISSFM